MFGLFSNIIRNVGRTLQPAVNVRQFHALPNSITSTQIIKPEITNGWSLIPLRTVMRNHFPKPSEYKRLKKHGFRAKLRTVNGRRQIMRRILKGRWYYTH